MRLSPRRMEFVSRIKLEVSDSCFVFSVWLSVFNPDLFDLVNSDAF